MKFTVIEVANGAVKMVKSFAHLDRAKSFAEGCVSECTYEKIPGKLWWMDDAISGFEVLVFDVENQHIVNTDD